MAKFKSHALVALLLVVGYGLMQFRATMGPSLLLEIGLFVLALIALIVAADNFTELAVKVGNSLGLSKLATGTLIVAIGTSAPEMFSSLSAALKGEAGMVIGNVYGTVVANTLLGIGAAATFAKASLPVHKDVFGSKMSIFLGAVLISTASMIDGVFDMVDGLLLLLLLVFYLAYVLKNDKHNQAEQALLNNDEDEEEEKETTTVLDWGLLVLSLSFLFISGDLVVDALIKGAEITDIMSAKLSSTILAVGTSIPEIAVAITIVRRPGDNNDQADLLLGEILGSNIFDIFGILGITSLILPLTMEPNLLMYLSGSMIVMFFVTNVVMNDRKIDKIEGLILLALFAVFNNQLVSI